MPRRDSSWITPVRIGGRPAKSLDQMHKKGIEPAAVAGDPGKDFDWDALYQAFGLDSDGRALMEQKQLGQSAAALGWSPRRTDSARKRVIRRLKKAKLASITREQFEVPMRGGDSRHLVFEESLGSGRVFTLSELTVGFAAIMGAEFPSEQEMKQAWARHEKRIMNYFCPPRPKSTVLRGHCRSTAMEHTTVKLELKNLTDQGTFEGTLAAYNNVDYGSDVLVPGSCTKTLSENQGKVALFMNHSTDDFRQKIGVLYSTDTPNALKARGVLNLDLPAAQQARSIMSFDLQHGLKTSMSIGYKGIVDKVENGIRFLKEIRLFEGSLVGIGMNDQATVTAAKSLQDERIAELLRQLKDSYQWLPSRERNSR